MSSHYPTSQRRSTRLARRQSVRQSLMALGSTSRGLPVRSSPRRGARSRGNRGGGSRGITDAMAISNPIDGLSRGMATRGHANRVGVWGGRGDSPVSGENLPGRVPPVQWDATRTEQLVTWLLTHAADRHILFHDKNTGESSRAPPAAPGDKPSGRNKKEVRLAIASHIFANDPIYGGQWAINSDRFQVSVMNRLVSSTDSGKPERQIPRACEEP
ncbi:hypothetical protein EDD15DRAFT_2199773 [Pisolithus albus]|nr:hypothetical protein EDD15DRAFT_2199773 [Pisolithus albus]